MPIIVNFDVMMAKRKMSLNELSEKVGLTLSNLSILKTGKAKAIRFMKQFVVYWIVSQRHFRIC
jgi:putative transcriptional regulator